MKEQTTLFLKRIKDDVIKYKWLMIVFPIYYIIVRIRFHAFCPMLIVTGLPCPGCGMTRAILLLLIGQWRRSWNLNPVAGGWIAAAIWFLYRRYWCGKKVTGWKIIILTLIACMIIVYVYRMIYVFPGYPPMTYNRHNISARIIPFYEELLRKTGFLGS